MEVDAIFFGHTHLPVELFSDSMLILNPGSIGSPPYPNNPSYCLIEIVDHKIISRFLRV